MQDPEVFEVEEARRSLRSSLPEVMRDLLTGAGVARHRASCVLRRSGSA